MVKNKYRPTGKVHSMSHIQLLKLPWKYFLLTNTILEWRNLYIIPGKSQESWKDLSILAKKSKGLKCYYFLVSHLCFKD